MSERSCSAWRVLHNFCFWWAILLLFLCLYSTIMSTKILENSTTLQSGSQRKHIFILAGQSNMAGRGGVNNKTWDGFVPHECHPNPSILRFNSGLTWEEAREPLHFDIDSNKTCGIGPGMVFANKILRKNLALATGEANNVIGLVPCAVGGTSLSEWSRGSKLYNAMITRARAAMVVDDDDDYGESVLEAVLWFQGERDTITQEEAECYKTRLEKFIQDFRRDLQSSNLPFFQVLLTSAQGPYMDTVREAQAAIRLPNVIEVEAKGLPLEIDGLHLSSLAQVQLGKMLAGAFLKWRTSQRPSNLWY